jgi:hypothetical protein
MVLTLPGVLLSCGVCRLEGYCVMRKCMGCGLVGNGEGGGKGGFKLTIMCDY